ncbi:MAG TPA: alpha/beta hydrolase [Acidimicrobiales bacterium]
MSAARSEVRVFGLDTSYLEAGDADAPPVVLLHDGAFGSDAETCWSPVIDAFAERYRVIAPDLLGHGGTAKVAFFDRDPMTQRIDHVRALCETLELDRPAFVGSSFGGGMVLRGAASGSLPMRCGVSICGPGGIHMKPAEFARLQAYEPTPEWARMVAELMVAQPADEVVEDRYQRSLAPGHYEALAAARLQHPARAGQEAPDWRPAYREALGRVTVPLLLVAGSDDVLLEPGWAEQMAELIPNGRAVVVDGARHQPHLDHTEETLAAVLAFLDEAVGAETVVDETGGAGS